MIRYIAVSPSSSIPSARWFWDGPEDNPLDLGSPGVFAEPPVGVSRFDSAPYLHVPRSGPNADGVVERVFPRKPRKGRVVAAEKRWGVWCWVLQAKEAGNG